MTDVLFYHLDDRPLERVLPPLVEKSLAKGWRVAVQSPSLERIEALDAHFWTYRDDSFLPHGTAQGSDAQRQPVLLQCDDNNANDADVRFLIDRAPLPHDVATYQRIVVVFDGEDEEALGAARLMWADVKARGFEQTYWQCDEAGRWQRKA